MTRDVQIRRLRLMQLANAYTAQSKTLSTVGLVSLPGIASAAGYRTLSTVGLVGLPVIAQPESELARDI